MLDVPAITRRTDRGIPRYDDANDSDIFLMGGADDLVPALVFEGGTWQRDENEQTLADGSVWRVRRYRPRTEGAFARIERWSAEATVDTHWRIITRGNVTTLYGKTANARIADPADPNGHVRGQSVPTTFLSGQERDAKGQRTLLALGNGATVRYTYDPLTFRLTELRTDRPSDGAVFQDLTYVYDPVGHVTETSDGAQQTRFFNNAVVPPEWRFEYDAVYQLVKATGREHASAIGDVQRDQRDIPVNPLPHPNDPTAVRNYIELYQYDTVGNITSVQHIANNASWTRRYQYRYQVDSTDDTNRLGANSVAGDPDGVFSAGYSYDDRGNITSMPHLAQLVWNALDQLKSVDLGGGGRAYYVYGSGGRRLRKVIERTGASKLDRIELGAVERYRENDPSGVILERWTLNLAEDAGILARIETKTIDTSDPTGLNQSLIRYQLRNLLGSVTVTFDNDAALISYEEYHPYGTSAYRSGTSEAEVSLKRYRLADKELDDETGLYNFGARFCIPWLGRWLSPDPGGFIDGLNLYRYAKNCPPTYSDAGGFESKEHKYKTIWTYDPKTFSKAEREIINNPDADPANVLGIFQHRGFSGAGPIEYSSELKGWVQTKPVGPSTGSDQPNAGAGGASSPSSGVPPRPAVQPPAPTEGVTPSTPIPNIDLPQAPPGTDFAAGEARGRATFRAQNPMAPGEQVQHWYKWRTGRETNLDPSITNDQENSAPSSLAPRSATARIRSMAGTTARHTPSMIRGASLRTRISIKRSMETT